MDEELGMQNQVSNGDELALFPDAAYFHVPFCNRRCGYCNFTLTARRHDLVPPYLEAISAELLVVRRRLINRGFLESDERLPIDTVFIGGGTPTYLDSLQTKTFWEAIDSVFERADFTEVSIEANPIDCTPSKLQVWADCGVNRISIGGQSLSSKKLEKLERDHSPEQLLKAVEVARRYFPQVSLDLIFACPGETLGDWEADLTQALKLPIDHLSTYGLTIERGSAFYGLRNKNALQEVEEEVQADMYELAIAMCHAHGFMHYEVSNFCRQDAVCRHNLKYWLGRPWFAFGPGAASYLPYRCVSDDAQEHAESKRHRLRATNHRSTTTYLKRVLSKQDWTEESHWISREEQLREALIFGLRRLQGVSMRMLSEEFSEFEVPGIFEPSLSQHIHGGLLETDGDIVRLTRRGLLICDSMLADWV